MLKPAKSLLKKAAVAHLNKRFKSNSLQMLFIIGHMRSGSSLLVHILNSNPEITGYGETHRLYHDKSDFGKVAFNIYRAFKSLPFNDTYVLDKVLHSYLVKDLNLLTDAKIIFLLRPPLQTLPSIHKLKLDGYTPLATFEYYIGRLEHIHNLARRLDSNKWSFITYDMLINNQAVAFKRIEGFLSLGTKLTSEYKTTWATGKRGIGDGSDNIQRGKIISGKKEVALPHSFEPFLDEAHEKYAECLKELSKTSSD